MYIQRCLNCYKKIDFIGDFITLEKYKEGGVFDKDVFCNLECLIKFLKSEEKERFSK